MMVRDEFHLKINLVRNKNKLDDVEILLLSQ